MSPLNEGGGPNPPYHESFLENIVGVSWGSGFTGAYIVVLNNGDFDTVLAVSTDGIKWNLWKIPDFLIFNEPTLWTISGGPGPNNTFVLQAAGAYEGRIREKAVLFHSTNLGRSWKDNTPVVLGDTGEGGSQIDGGGYSYSAKAAIATTWAYSPLGVFNSVLMLQGGKWKILAQGPDPPFGGWEFRGGIIPDDTICYNTAGGGFDEFPPIYYDPVSTKCPYIGPDGESGFYQGTNTAIGPPGILNGGPDFILTTFRNGLFIDVPVKQLNDTKLFCNNMFFASNFGFGPPVLDRSTSSAALIIS